MIYTLDFGDSKKNLTISKLLISHANSKKERFIVPKLNIQLKIFTGLPSL